MQTQQQQRDVCAICLGVTNPKGGGEFLLSPGCCGKWFHQSCIEDMKKSGKNFCPACMKAFPGPAFTIPTHHAPVPLSPPPPNYNYANIFGAPSHPVVHGSLEEDLITAADQIDEVSYKPVEKPTKKPSGTPDEELQITITPEYPEEGLAAKCPFHARISVAFTPDQSTARQNGIDVVCVLDNSGSMSGSKIDNLKRAMEFVISTLQAKDRLSIILFNSTARPLQGLWKMDANKKQLSTNIIRSITAGGGTDIYRGMQAGWQVLQQRQTRNPASCMFLLTDGQDGSYLTEKKQLAKQMRDQGTSLFVFGFGNDHDSAHLLEIANAAEGSFVYIETNETVVDAFGGAIGTQQGQLLRNISVQFQMTAVNVQIEHILAGSYLQENDNIFKRSGKVKFADLYGGEKRDFLLQLKVPEIPSPVDSYELFSIQAQYQHYGDDVTVLSTVSKAATIRRVAVLPAGRVRNADVDEQVQRLEVTNAIQEAMASADSGNYKAGQEKLEKMKEEMKSSVAYNAGNKMVRGLWDDLNNCQSKIRSRDEYVSFGGRAMISETATTYSKQRAVYAKTSNMLEMQSASSAVCQTSAWDYRNNNQAPSPFGPPPTTTSVPAEVAPPLAPPTSAAPSAKQSSIFGNVFSFGQKK